MLSRLREPRRLAAIALLALTGGIVLAFLVARGDLAAADARAYWAAVRFWLGGADPYAPAAPYMPYAYAPWTLYLFLPWALLPWEVAWFVWRAASVVPFAATVAWAYERRPLATAAIVVLLAIPLAANFDTGNINVLLVLGVWAAYFTGARLGGLLWAIGAAMKWLPAGLIVFLPPRARLWGVAFAGLFALFTLATWPQTLRHIDIAFNFPRPVRLDYLILAWAAVPWLWAREWPAPARALAEARQRLERLAADPAQWLRSYFGLAGTTGTSKPAAEDRR